MRLQTQVAPEIQKRLLLSRVEAESLKERDILCPTCGFRIQRVFSDATGHLSVKCQKCKNVHILNLAYFRRIRRNRSHQFGRWWRDDDQFTCVVQWFPTRCHRMESDGAGGSRTARVQVPGMGCLGRVGHRNHCGRVLHDVQWHCAPVTSTPTRLGPSLVRTQLLCRGPVRSRLRTR